MTRYEKLSTVLSIVAIVMALVTPVLAYFWFDPQMQSFRNRSKLKVTLGGRNGGGAGGNFSHPDYAIITTGGRDRSITVINLGDLPARGVLITAQYPNILEAKPPKLSRPYPLDVSIQESFQFIALGGAIAPHDAVEVTFPREPKIIWVSNEHGDTSTIITGAGAFKVDTKTLEVTTLDVVPPVTSLPAFEKTPSTKK